MTTTDTGTQTGGPAQAAGPSIVPQGPARLALIAVTIAVLAQTLRFSLPQFGHLSESAGAGGVAALVLLTHLAGFLAPVIRTVGGPRALVAVGVGGLLAVRLVAQAVSPQLWLAFAGTALGMIAVAGLYEAARGLSGVGFATAAVAGLAIDTAVRMTFATWDPVWQSGVGPWAVCVLLVGLGFAALARELSSGSVPAPGVSWRDALGAAALGPFLALQVLALSSPAFVASAGWQSLTGAGVTVLAGQALALGFLASGLAVRAVPGGVCVLGGTVLGLAAGAVAGTYAISGMPAVAIVVAGQVLSAWLLAVACRAPLRRAGLGGQEVRRVDLGAALGGLLIAVILVPYGLGAVRSLPIPNNLLPGLAGILLGLLAAIAAARGGPLPARAPLRALTAGGSALVLLAGTLGFIMTTPGQVHDPVARTSLRVVSYNLHEAVDGRGRVDLEGAAQAIGEQRADVVLLQEVSRGSLSSGTTDVGVWLSRRLDMHLIWGPATDGQSGNAILTSRPVRSSGTARLPHADGAQLRGYVWARLDVAGRVVTVWSTQLQGGAGQSRIRTAEIGQLIQDWGDAPRTIIGGDLNADTGSPEMGRLDNETDLRSALGDASGPTTKDGSRTDWLLGTDDLIFSDAAVHRSGPSDHYPVAVTVKISG
ncbi:endonuclease/exonuclease/phosphatase family protein [Actinomadura scrupuli]|uniref:endonuclease/exonuclease/phosphatase family protein n=1 Tax=Actinomadura scrupuli TaxID=559629 RepID=UPI003D984CD2